MENESSQSPEIGLSLSREHDHGYTGINILMICFQDHCTFQLNVANILTIV